MENNKIDSKIEEKNKPLIGKRAVFLKAGSLMLSLFLIYESLIYIFLNKLEIMGIILFSFPILPFIIITEIFNLNDYLMWFLAGFSYFIFGGVLGLIISKMKNKS